MRKVMLVEDEEFILQGIRYIMDWEQLGMEVTAMVQNGRDALEIFRREPVDIILTDVEMPGMNGLQLLEEIRKTDSRTRAIILSGYDEFEYARTALHLDVEEYILKPINEEKLQEALTRADRRLSELDRDKAGSIEDKISWLRFLKGNLEREEAEHFYQMLPDIGENEKVYAAVMKICMDTLGDAANTTEILIRLQKSDKKIKCIYLSSDTLFLLLYTDCATTDQEVADCYRAFQDELESSQGILCFVTVSESMTEYRRLPDSYKAAMRLQKYKLLEGYGSCINENHIKDRKSRDVVIDEAQLRKLILKKDKDGTLSYIEDLFINNLKSEVNVEVLYQMSLKIAMLLQEIKVEYKLIQSGNLKELSEIIEKIYQVDDLLGLKTVFISEIVEIIDYLHTEDSQYTPVVKQIMAEVQKNYQEDMNLKLLSYKYHMNASYLGQIFQKEAGCSFAQYLSNTKNGIAKDLILNTNMKINDIAKAVGYPNTSYFYRKFKQCYGVSPASLRTMKKY